MTRRRTFSAEPSYGLSPVGRAQTLDKFYLGFVKDNKDADKMGRLKVWIPELSSNPNVSEHWLVVNYCSPFAGATTVDDITKPRSDEEVTFAQTQKSYGLWFVPPDLENEVLCLFINGDPSRGVWIGGLYGQKMNHMIPGIGVANTPEGKFEPSAEYNKRSTTPVENPIRPTHSPLCQGLTTQGLITDQVRGTSTSSAQREAPSRVMGILTPRGTQFVMDDGFTENELKEQRSPKGGIDFNKETNPAHIIDPILRSRSSKTFRESEFIRFRTRSGAQILISESDGFVYFISRDGNTWLELNNEGQVDIYGAKDISIRSEANVNIRADADVNIEAGKNVNIKAAKDFKRQARVSGELITPGSGTSGGNVNIESVVSTNIKAGDSIFATAAKDIHSNAGSNIIGSAGSNFTSKAGGNIVGSAGGNYSTKAGKNMMGQAGRDLSQLAGNVYKETARAVHMNGPAADPALDAGAASPAQVKPVGQAMDDWDLVVTGKITPVKLASIVERLPQHEPWAAHAIKDIISTRNNVEEGPANPAIKRGADTEGADLPIPFVDNKGQKKDGIGYKPDGTPIYDLIGLTEVKNVSELEISQRGADLIANEEATRLGVYDDRTGEPFIPGRAVEGNLTIGTGHLLTLEELQKGTITIDGEEVSWEPPNELTQDQALDLYNQDLSGFRTELSKAIPDVKLTQNQYDAVTSLAFNMGVPAFKKTSVFKNLQSGNYEEVPAGFKRIIKTRIPPGSSNLVTSTGLVARRNREVALWNLIPPETIVAEIPSAA